MKALLLFSTILVGTLGSPKTESEVDNRILFGLTAIPGQFPYQVLLTAGQNIVPYCGGSILTKKHILTAAQCKVKKGHIVIAGEHDITNNANDNEQLRKVEWTVAHSNYDPNTYENDIRIVVIHDSFDFNGYVQNVKLPTVNFEEYDEGTETTISGWSFPSSTSLKFIKNYVVMDTTCDNFFQTFIEPMLCTKSQVYSAEACDLDIGGPLVEKWHPNDKYHGSKQIGILSYGHTCGNFSPWQPLVYTQVSYYLKWINQFI